VRQAEGSVLNLENHIAVGLDVVVGLRALVHRVLVHLVAVDVGHVAGVDAALHRLQIVALLQTLRDEYVAFRQGAPLDLGRLGLLVLRSHIGPDDAGALDAGISLDPHFLARLRRRRHVDAPAIARELEAVVGAPDAVFLVAAEVERSAAVRAEFVDQADLALGIAKREQLLAEDRHAHLRAIGIGDFARQQDRHPVAAHQVAHPGAGAAAHECFRHLLVHRSANLLAVVVH
jgi:hypothetical protein